VGVTGSDPSGDGQIIDISEAANVSFTLAGGSGIALSSRRVSAIENGNGMVLASLDLGGGSSLADVSR
jgi:hypothetical protein